MLNHLAIFTFSVFLSSFLFAAKPLNFELLAQALAAPNGPRTVEATLEWVSQNYPEQFSHYTLMRESRSAQESTPLNPRAIVFGTDARLVFSFNGNPSQQGYDFVELIQFREADPTLKKGAEWEFRELGFDRKGKKPPQISEANPGKCTQCHYQPLRPIWEPYETWPGAYGKYDDAIIDYAHDKYAPIGAPSAKLKEQQQEFADFQTFRMAAKAHPRYRWLPMAEDSNVAPYSPGVKSSDYDRRPNLKLTELLAPLHAKRMVSWLSQNETLFHKYSTITAAQFIGCAEQHSTEKEMEAIAGSLNKQIPEFLKPTAWNKPGWSDANFKGGSFFSLFGLEATDFNLSREPQYWHYFTGVFYSSEYFAKELYTQLSAKDADLPQFDRISSYNFTVRYPGTPAKEGEVPKGLGEACAVLYQKYLSKEKNENVIVTPPAIAPFTSCLGCHGPTGNAPRIPFENQKQLLSDQRIINEIRFSTSDTSATKQMPPQRKLSAKERTAILNFLAGLDF